MKKGIFEISENRAIKPNVHLLRLSGDSSAQVKPGMFINIELPGLFLRRPISVCDWDDKSITVIYKTVGRGTEVLSSMKKGDRLDVLTGLGNGFDLSLSGPSPLLLGGGLGLTPMFCLSKALIAQGVKPRVILGFNTAEEVFYEAEFEALGADITVCTADGSYGEKGFVTDIMKKLDYSYFYTCGPGPMFAAINRVAEGSGQFSLEARMGCGFGACVGCTIETKSGPRRVCKDGPVFKREELIWAD